MWYKWVGGVCCYNNIFRVFVSGLGKLYIFWNLLFLSLCLWLLLCNFLGYIEEIWFIFYLYVFIVY